MSAIASGISTRPTLSARKHRDVVGEQDFDVVADKLINVGHHHGGDMTFTRPAYTKCLPRRGLLAQKIELNHSLESYRALFDGITLHNIWWVLQSSLVPVLPFRG